jgi:hypothetical protein
MVLDERRPDDRGESSSTGRGGRIAAAEYVDPLKLASLPRLARERDSQIQSAPRSLTDRLNQMRVEDRRRERNNEQRQNGTLPSRQMLPFDATTSASARAGSLYYQSSQLAQKDITERQQLSEMRRKFAGPTPPTSWRKKIARDVVDNGMVDEACDDSPLARRRATLAIRHFLNGCVEEGALPRLSNLCLARISGILCDVDDHDSVSLAGETTTFLPVHLKERMMALAGREQQCEALNASALSLLIGDRDRMERAPLEEEERTESWDGNEEKLFDPISLKNMDLSFARIGNKMLKNVLTQGADMHQLRTLSLAGWGSDDHSGQKSLLTVPNLMEAIGNLPHLELLSIAKTRLWPVSKGSSLKTKESSMLESITFLKRLSRASLRLKVLDLSECDWIIGPDIANLGWFSVDRVASRSKIIWPRLEQLVLLNCATFIEPGKIVDEKLKPSPSYVAKWHAAHHGVALVTDSPYLLSHRPGLGHAVFRAEDAQQARFSRQRRSARQQARREEDAWGSPQNSDDEDSSIRSSSSSAYPTRCPVSGVHVGAWEWERARVLDAVRGRWGSAIKGDITNENTSASGETFIEIYF